MSDPEPQTVDESVPEESGATAEAAVIERIFNAPRELVWRAWSEAEHFARWYGPTGFTVPSCEIDFRVGGRYLVGMRSPDGFEMWMTGVYQEIVPLERFVATACLADESGNVVPATHYGMGADVPTETLLTVVLESLDDSRTKVTLRQSGWTDPQMAAQAGAGWEQAFDKLVTDLASA